MKTMHHIHVTDEYLKGAQRLVHSQHLLFKLLYVNRWFSWLPPIIFSGYLVLMASFGMLDWFSGVFFASLLIVSLANQFYKPRTLAKARNRNPLKGSVVTQLTDENGIDSVSQLGNSHIHWAAISRALVYPHGVLLKLKTRQYIWLPDDSLTEGSAEDLRKLIAEHVTDVEVRRN